jgi:hypothetical protein
VALSAYELTEGKMLKLKPLVERILSKKYGKEIKFIEFTFGNITVKEEKRSEENEV